MWRREVADLRSRPQIPAHVFAATLFAMFVARVPSFNELEQHRGKSCWRRWLGGWRMPCADELAYASERMVPDTLRQCLWLIHAKLKRNKMLGVRDGWMLAAIDGHELRPSYKRCCGECLRRKVETKHGTKTQFYHRIVVLHLLGSDFRLLLDVELVRPGEDEVAAALRLLRRVLESHPRCFDVLSADAIYLRPSVIGLLAEHGKHLIATLKDNQPDLLGEARTLLAEERPDCFTAPGSPPLRVETRQADGFLSESIRTPLRIVSSHETGTRRTHKEGELVEEQIDVEWFWATTMPSGLSSARFVRQSGHDRWEIENQGFNELCTYWHADHGFHHHPNSIVAIWLMLFMAVAVFHCFHSRNLKPEARAGHTVIYFARMMTAGFSIKDWWPPPPG